jgi:hypothetical protein
LTQSRKDIIAWVGSHVLPREAAVLAWLERWTGRDHGIDDVIQEAHCRLAAKDVLMHQALLPARQSPLADSTRMRNQTYCAVAHKAKARAHAPGR